MSSDSGAVERLVELRGPAGLLTGILHLPRATGSPSRHAILMPPAGMRDRTGPMRLYTRLARRLCEAGYPVLRYDGTGLGESEGDHPAASRVDADAAVQRGALAEEIAAAARFVAAETDRRVVVVGLGGGVCHGAQLARLAPELVAGLFGIGMSPLRADPVSARRGSPIRPAASSRAWPRRLARALLRRALEPSAWRRLLEGRSDYAALGRSIRALLPRRRRDLGPVGRGRGDEGLPALAARAFSALERADGRVDRGTWEALIRLRATGCPVALAWGELDPSLYVFDDHLARRVEGVAKLFARRVVPGGSHECASGEAFEELTRLALEFLDDLEREGRPRVADLRQEAMDSLASARLDLSAGAHVPRRVARPSS